MNKRAGILIAGGILAGAAISAPLAAGRIEAGMLDRLAEIQRLHNQQGVNLPGIAIILDLLGR